VERAVAPFTVRSTAEDERRIPGSSRSGPESTSSRGRISAEALGSNVLIPHRTRATRKRPRRD